MKRLFALSFILCLFVTSTFATATARIFAYDLRLTTEGDNYTFSFKANETPTEAALVFYSVGTGKIIGEKPLVGIVKGENSVTLSRNELAGGGTMNWGVKLHGANIATLQTVFTDNTTAYKRGFAVVNTNPESDYFGRIYGIGTKATPNFIQDYLVDYTLSTKTNYFSPSSSIGNPQRSCVAQDGTLYIADYGDAHPGVFTMNPSTHALNAIFTGDGLSTDGNGLITTSGGAKVASSSPGCFVYGEGKDTKLYAVQEDFSGHPVTMYQLGQEDGTVLTTWASAPTRTYTISGHDGGNSQIIVCDKGFWLCQYRGTNTTAVPSLMFYTLDGTRTFSSGGTDAMLSAIPQNYRGGFAISQDGSQLAININSVTFTLFDIEWSGSTPSLTNKRDITHSYGQMGQMAYDYAGNLIAVAGSYDTSMKLYVFATPTNNNECTVPAKKSLTVYAPLSGTFKIGGDDANYTSLYVATKDINKCGISADVTLLIGDNLVETKNPCLTNPTDYTITIRPDQDANRKISFKQSTDNTGPSGGFIIGGVEEVSDNKIGWNTALTNNIVIDGYPEGGTTRRLTFDTPQGFGSSAGPIVFFGDVHNSKIINCIVNNDRNAGTTGVTIRTADMSKLPEGTPNKRPENILIENNIIAPRVNGQGVVIRGTEASVPGTGAPLGTIIRNNRITAENRGVFLNGVNGLLFENNELIMNGAAGFNAHGVFGNSQVVGDIIIKNNKIKITTLQTAAADNGIVAIGSSGSISGREEDVHWYIDNNYFYGMDALASPEGTFKLIYIRAADNTTIRHNTFYIPTFTNTVPMDLVAARCASAVYLASSHTYSAQNNIFVCEETSSKVSLIRGALNTNIRNNIFYHAGGNGAIVAGAAVYNTYNDLPETYRTTYNNKNIHVEFSDGYRFTDEYANNINLGVEHLDGFNYDIEGNTRNFPTRAGCYDPAWSITLDQTANNDAVLTDFDNILVDATLKRPFIADGGWYTLVLPFDVTAGQIAEAFGAGTEVAVLQNSRWKSADEMYLNFQKQATIEAGVPCLIKPTETIASEVTFHDVTIDKELTEIETDLVNMIGFYKPTTITLDDDNYYLGNSNLLYEYNTEYASSYATPNGFRAYFHFDFTPPAGCAARVVFHEDTTTGIEESPETQAPAATKVIREGQLLIIRDGKEYNAQGQLVR